LENKSFSRFFILIFNKKEKKDTESRRIAPVAVLSDNGYLDLINGPQDHGWCFGYTCQKRISTFLSLVVSNHSYDIYLSSTPPNQLRFRIIQSNSAFKIRLSMSYTTSNNINVYKASKLILPTNADNSTGTIVLKDPQGNANQYMPTFSSLSGTNYMDRTARKIYFSMDGNANNYIDLVISEEIYLSFGVGAISTTAFFNSDKIVSNVAALLGVPPSMIKKVQIVSATGTSKRSSRQVSNQGSKLTVVIGNDPPSVTNETVPSTTNSNQLQNITASIATQFYFGQLQKTAASLNISIKTLDLQVNKSQSSLRIIGGLNITQDISGCRAQSPCDKQPIIQLVDQDVTKKIKF
jgi:hypothetical protein